MKFVIAFLCIFTSSLLSGQNFIWQKTLQYRSVKAVFCDENIIVAGSEDLPAKGAIAQGFVQIFDDAGNTVAQKVMGSAMADVFNSVISDGENIFLTGTTWEKQKANQLWFVKMDRNANVLVNRRLGDKYDDFGYNIILTSDGNLLITGASKQNEGDLINLWLIKLDKDGNIIWQKNFGTLDHGEAGLRAKELPEGYLIMAKKWVNKGPAVFDSWLLLIDKQTGSLIWTREYPDAQDNVMLDAIENGNGLYFVGFNSNQGDENRADLWLVAMNRQGRAMTSRTFGTGLNERGVRIFDKDGKFLVVGNSGNKASYWIFDQGLNMEERVLNLGDILYDAALCNGKLILVGGIQTGFIKVLPLE